MGISELVSCSCEALDGSLLPVPVEVNYIVNNKELLRVAALTKTGEDLVCLLLQF